MIVDASAESLTTCTFCFFEGFVLGLEGLEEGEPGPGGSASRGRRVCREGRSVGPHPQLQEEPQLQHSCQVVRSGTVLFPDHFLG